MTTTAAAPIDPLGPVVAPGRYEDALVVVQRWSGAWPRRSRGSVRTDHFDVVPLGGRLSVTHRLGADEVDDDLAGLIVDELFGPGWVRGPEMFERIFTGVVRSTAEDALESWETFYRNTIERLERARAATSAPSGAMSPEVLARPASGGGGGARVLLATAAGHGSIAGYAPVYDRACELVVPGSVLEVGCCFGFLALRLAAQGRSVIASDVSAGTMRLLDAVAPRLGLSVRTLLADAARMPLDDDCADTVLVIHLLEHLDEDHGTAVVREAVRCARRRVVVAVPFEVEADESYGHVRTVTLADLRAWGRATGLPYDVAEHHGGWLVVDTT